MITCTRRLEWDAMHRIPQHESKCRAFHGHRYVAEVTCLAESLDGAGRVVDFGVVKERVGGWIDRNWDHTAILMRGDPDPAAHAVAASNASVGRPVYWLSTSPTAENVAAELARVAVRVLRGTGVEVVRIRVWETPNGSAEWTASVGLERAGSDGLAADASGMPDPEGAELGPVVTE
jgi:6-pyruvoyltetrahydropterin/6-carboxytetrahydropterin synthase